MSISSISAASSAALYQQAKSNVPLSATPASTVSPAAQVQQAGQAAQTGQLQETGETQRRHRNDGDDASSIQSSAITQSGTTAAGALLNALV